MSNHKSLVSVITIVILLIGVAGQAHSQAAGDEKPRRIRFISGNSSGSKVDSSGKVIRRKTIALERSELSETADNALLEKEAFDLINLRRLERGLSELIWSQELADLAKEHSENMAVYGFFSHTGLNGRLVDARAVDFGIDDWSAIGENIAYNKGYDNPTSFAVERWMLSDGHRKNLLDGMWKQSGLGIAVTKDGKYFFTQVFMVRD